MKKPTKDELVNLRRDIERIYSLALKSYKRFDEWHDPMDDIFVTEKEAKLINENNKLKKELTEQKSVNEHLKNIYKRDTRQYQKEKSLSKVPSANATDKLCFTDSKYKKLTESKSKILTGKARL